MERKETDPTFRLKRRQLSMMTGPGERVYLYDGQARPPQAWILARDAFTEAVRARRIVARAWTVVVPRSDCLVKTVALPADTPEEARKMLEFEVAALVPIPTEKLCYDFLPLPGDKENESNCLVFLVPRDRLEQAAAPLRDAGVEPERILASSLALLNWQQSHQESAAGKRGAPIPADSSDDLETETLFIAIDDTRYEVLCMRNGALVSLRQGPIDPSRDIEPTRLLPELAHRAEPGSHSDDAVPVIQVFLAGAPDRTRALHECMAVWDDLGVQTQVLFELPAVTNLAPPESQDDTSAISIVSVLCAMGASLASSMTDRFNLLPPEWGQSRERWRRWTESAKTVVAVACPFVVLYATLLVAIHRLENECSAILQQIEPIHALANELENKKRQSQVIHVQLSDRALPLAILAELYRSVPASIHLSHLSMDLDPAEPVLKMRGPADSLDAAFSFPIVLEKSSLFSDVRPEAAQQVSRGQGMLVEYGCQCRVNIGASSRLSTHEGTPRERR